LNVSTFQLCLYPNSTKNKPRSGLFLVEFIKDFEGSKFKSFIQKTIKRFNFPIISSLHQVKQKQTMEWSVFV